MILDITVRVTNWFGRTKLKKLDSIEMNPGDSLTISDGVRKGKKGKPVFIINARKDENDKSKD